MSDVFTAETRIGAPADEVFRRLTDWDTAPRWMPGVTAIRADGPRALLVTVRGRERRSEIVALEPGRAVTLRSVQGGVTADYRYTCAADGDGTVVRLVAGCRMTGPIRLLGPVIRAAIRRADSGQLRSFAATF